jgi:aminopeptidase N
VARVPRWLKLVLLAVPGLILLVSLVFIGLGWYITSQMQPSGGELPEAMARYDVRHTDLELAIDPERESLRGHATVTVAAIADVARFEIHLDDRLEVVSVAVDDAPVGFDHRGGVIGADLGSIWSPGSRHRVDIAYGGRPKTALRPPWIDGFVWSETDDGLPWIGVTSEGDGGDNWWPCKDHPSDEPDEGMDIALTVPGGLVGLANGRPMGDEHHADGTVTSRWRVGFPINNYDVSVNIGPYVPLEVDYDGVDGTLRETVIFWVIPEAVDRARPLVRSIPDLLRLLGRRFGEYPFFADKLWFVHAPYLGMEHQTLIAYGGDFRAGEFGFDALLLHELAHEWWGNKITAMDWADVWLHEGFATYAEALYVLDTQGEDRYLEYMQRLRERITNRAPVIRGVNLTAHDVFSPDVYVKGAWVLHMLRFIVGEERMAEILWRFADGDHPGACRLVTTRDFTRLAERVVDADLGWIWQRYLYTAELPVWTVRRTGDGATDVVTVEWNDPEFEMPLPVRVGDDLRRVAMPGGRAELHVAPGTPVVVDPDGEVLTAN